jgi:hypothetical protein
MGLNTGVQLRLTFNHPPAAPGDIPRTLAQATMVTGPAGASVDVLARKAFLNPACQNEVGLVAVVPGVLRLEPRRPLPDGRLSDHLAVSELIPRQINFHASRKPIPHVRFRSLAVAEDVRRQDFSAKDVVQDQRRNVALLEQAGAADASVRQAGTTCDATSAAGDARASMSIFLALGVRPTTRRTSADTGVGAEPVPLTPSDPRDRECGVRCGRARRLRATWYSPSPATPRSCRASSPRSSSARQGIVDGRPALTVT